MQRAALQLTRDSKLADYIEAGKALDADERLEAAHQVLLSVDRDAGADRVDIDKAWDEAVDRRVKGIVSGEAPLVDGREAHTQVHAEIAALRK
jgi:Putative addiction module component